MIEEFLMRMETPIQEGLTLIGHDWGSILTQMMAGWGRLPLRRVVLVSVPPIPTLLKNLSSAQL